MEKSEYKSVFCQFHSIAIFVVASRAARAFDNFLPSAT